MYICTYLKNLKNYKSSFKFKNSRVTQWKHPDLLNLFIVIHIKNQYMYNTLPYQYQLLQAIQTTTYTQYIPQPLTLKPPEPKRKM